MLRASRLSFSAPLVLALIALAAAGCGGASPPAASASSASSHPLAETPPPSLVRSASAEAADGRPHSNLIYPYNLPEYRDDLAAALGKADSAPSTVPH